MQLALKIDLLTQIHLEFGGLSPRGRPGFLLGRPALAQEIRTIYDALPGQRQEAKKCT